MHGRIGDTPIIGNYYCKNSKFPIFIFFALHQVVELIVTIVSAESPQLVTVTF